MSFISLCFHCADKFSHEGHWHPKIQGRFAAIGRYVNIEIVIPHNGKLI